MTITLDIIFQRIILLSLSIPTANRFYDDENYNVLTTYFYSNVNKNFLAFKSHILTVLSLDPLAKYSKSEDQENAFISLVCPSIYPLIINFRSFESIVQSFNKNSVKEHDTNRFTLSQYIINFIL